MATTSVTNPAKLDPTATRKNVRKNVRTELIWLKRMKPRAVVVMPMRIMMRGPKRSIAQPWKGPRMPLSIRVMAKASPKVVLLHSNSSSSSET